MASRLELQAAFEGILGSRNVYFKPPSSVNMKYPAIVYNLKNINNVHANDSVYLQRTAYEVTIIDRNPDSLIPNEVSKLPTCKFDRSYTADNLNHWVYTLFF